MKIWKKEKEKNNLYSVHPVERTCWSLCWWTARQCWCSTRSSPALHLHSPPQSPLPTELLTCTTAYNHLYSDMHRTSSTAINNKHQPWAVSAKYTHRGCRKLKIPKIYPSNIAPRLISQDVDQWPYGVGRYNKSSDEFRTLAKLGNCVKNHAQFTCC